MDSITIAIVVGTASLFYLVGIVLKEYFKDGRKD